MPAPTITYNVLQEEKEIYPTEQEKAHLLTHNYGYIELKAPESETVTMHTIHIIINIDRSGSMYADFGTLQHCVCRMLEYLFEKQQNNIYITIIFFNEDVETPVMCVPLHTQSNLEKMKSQVQTMDARGMTNLQNAFGEVKRVCHNKPPHYKTHHIFFTDGRATAGACDIPELVSECIVNSVESHTMIGFTEEHNAELLYEISISEPMHQYYYIPSIEEVGFVYGELIDKILHPVYYDITFCSTLSIEFYDSYNCGWTKLFTIPRLCSGETKTVTFRFPWGSHKDQLKCTITGMEETFEHSDKHGNGGISSAEYNAFVKNIACHYNSHRTSSIHNRNLDVMRHVYRQKALECVNEGIKKLWGSNDDTTLILSSIYVTAMERSARKKARVQMRERIGDLFEEINDFCDANEIPDDEMLRSVMDDLFLIYSTAHQKLPSPVQLARYQSQIDQRAYLVMCDELDDTNSEEGRSGGNSYGVTTHTPPMTPRRTRTQSGSGSSTGSSLTQNSIIEDPIPAGPASCAIHHYTPSQHTFSQYTSPQRLSIMRNVSQPAP